jgi:hypothetical protein
MRWDQSVRGDLTRFIVPRRMRELSCKEVGMPRKRFSPEQIVATLRQIEAAEPSAVFTLPNFSSSAPRMLGCDQVQQRSL